MEPSSPTMIEVQNISFSYPSEGTGPAPFALEDISFDVPRGSFVAVLGRNGSGKSTLARLLNGYHRPVSGRVLVDGIDTSDEARELDVRRRVGMVFQNPDNQLVATVVKEDVAFGPENLGVPSDEIVTRVRQSLEEVGMWEYHAHEPHRLSGGQKQRVAIAGVLAMRPECIVLDEPTAMLDPRGRREVMDTLLRLRRDEGMTLVLITHFMEEAALADTLVVMDAGHVVLTGAPLQVFSQVDRIRALGLDAPAGAELLTRLRASGMDIPRLALTARDCAEILAEVLTGTG